MRKGPRRVAIDPVATMSMSIPDIVAARTDMWSVAEMAALLNVSHGQLYDLIKTGRMPSISVGTTIRFDPKVTAAWLRERSR